MKLGDDAASKGFQHVNHIEMNEITIFLFVPAPSSGWCAKTLFRVAKNGTLIRIQFGTQIQLRGPHLRVEKIATG